MGLTYKDAGVDIDAGNALVERIKPLARATLRPEVLAGIGGFAGLCGLPGRYREPILVSGTDGVGTKLKSAFATRRHDTVGVDLVAMCVNDVATCGAEPLFFLDYFACGRLDVEVAEKVVAGIAEGCRQAGLQPEPGAGAGGPGLARCTRDVAALSHSGYAKANPAARSRPGTTRRLLSSNSVSERRAHAPNSAIQRVAGSPTGTPQAVRSIRMKSRCGRGPGEARFTGPSRSSRAIRNSTARTKSSS